MSKISVYVENSFASLPRTKEAVEMKLNIIENMEEKYAELLAQGRSENEAFGAVVSEFGSIEEIRQELGLPENPAGLTPAKPELPPALAEEYEAFRRKFAAGMTTGVTLCILAVVALLVMMNFWGEDSNVPVILFLCVIAVAVAIFVYFGLHSEKYEKLKQEYEAAALPALRQKNRKTEKLSSVIMLTATAVFLLLGFVWNLWHPGWVVFPIGGILCGIVSVLAGDDAG